MGRSPRTWLRSAGEPDYIRAARAGFALWQMGRPEESVLHLTRAIASWPDRWQLHMVVTTAYRRLERCDEALASIKTAISLAPDQSSLCGHLAHVECEANRAPHAHRAALRAIELDGTNWFAYFWASESARLCGDQAHAVEYARSYDRLRPGGGIQMLGRAQLACGRWVEAEATLRQAFAVSPEFSDIPTYLALALIPQRRLAEAKRTAATAVRNQPKDRIARLLWDRIVEWEAAEAELRHAIKCHPDARHPLASLLVQQGRFVEAGQLFDDGCGSLDVIDQNGRSPMLALELELRDERARRQAEAPASTAPSRQ